MLGHAYNSSVLSSDFPPALVLAVFGVRLFLIGCNLWALKKFTFLQVLFNTYLQCWARLRLIVPVCDCCQRDHYLILFNFGIVMLLLPFVGNFLLAIFPFLDYRWIVGARSEVHVHILFGLAGSGVLSCSWLGQGSRTHTVGAS